MGALAGVGAFVVALGCGSRQKAGSSGGSGGTGGARTSATSSGSATGASGATGGSATTGTGSGGGAAGVQVPGPSPELYAAPFYSCLHDYYVSTTGSDTSGDGSQAAPWQTLQKANDAGPKAGDCINVEPGTYPAGVTITHGGDLASATGYVVYRCAMLDQCKITDSPRGFSFSTASFPMPSYLVFDGFELAAASPVAYGQGVLLWDGNEGGPNAKNSSHHVWVLNNVIHGYGQSGVQMNDGELFYVIHNKIHDNAGVTCDAQGSGVSLVVLKAFAGLAPTADDKKSPSPLIGSLEVGGSFFHNVIAWNVVYNNALTQCGTASNASDTDGNNIILDTFNNAGSTNVAYPNPSLAAFNVVYNAGGGGVHVFRSGLVTVANNTCFNNYLDPYNSGSARGCIDSAESYGNTFINNIAVGVPASHPKCAYGVAPYAMWNNAFIGSPPQGSTMPDTFSHNISFLRGGASCQGETLTNDGDSYSCTSNACGTDPKWVDVGTTSLGSETTPPSGANFALAAGSPAIGKGQMQPYLPAQAVDIGACSHTLTQCP
jgi:hypothetical protein